MMTALVVFESMFGNTKVIADAVAEGLARHLPVRQVEVGAAPTVIGGEVELLVVGGPTHAFGLSRPRLPGSAAAAADKRLRRLGFRRMAPPTSFYVEGTTGPLLDGEAERARRLGEALAAEVGAAGRRHRRVSRPTG